ncbi:alpha/beta fold hydrolase [Burkholderia sp. 4701]|nr:alpha/beta fold hydrolase [Burkholderia sp. 4701]MXN86419.1 alpha/beta fold hydrolase [Burkholderia sp. 4812]
MTSIAPRLDRFAHAGSDAAALPRTLSQPAEPELGGAIRNLVPPSAHGAHVLCIPWAGASIERFFGWKHHLPDGAGLSGVQLPGRGTRTHEALPTDLPALLDEIAAAYLKLPDPPRILLGHSFGALIAYELAMRVNGASGAAPITRIVASGLSAPQVIADERRIAHLDDDAFGAEVLALNGIPRDLTRNPEMLRYFMDILRCDFRLFESYRFDPDRPRLRCPFVVCNGRADPGVSEQGVRAWASLTTGECRFHDFDGDHFFITSSVNAGAMLRLALEAETASAC